jgi:hypothetical protein
MLFKVSEDYNQFSSLERDRRGSTKVVLSGRNLFFNHVRLAWNDDFYRKKCANLLYYFFTDTRSQNNILDGDHDMSQENLINRVTSGTTPTAALLKSPGEYRRG